MRFLRRALVGLFLMAVTLGVLAYAGSTVWTAVQTRMNAEPRSFPQRERVVSVNVVTYESRRLTPELLVFGELRSRRTLDLRTTVGGNVVEVSDSFVEGGTVAAGDILVWIDPIEAQAALASAEADLADTRAERRGAEVALGIARDELAAAEAQAGLRQQALARQRDLQARGIGTAPDLEAAELAASSADQTVLARRQSLAEAEARLAATETAIARRVLLVEEARRTLEGTEIRAAFDGVLAAVSVGPGARVTANEQIAQLVDPAALEVAFRISTSQYADLTGATGTLPSAPVEIALDVAGVSLTAQGRITRESAVVGAGQTGRLIFAEIGAAPGFRPGDFVTVTVAEPPLENVARLPGSAYAADGTILIVGEEDRLTVAPVELLRRQGDDVIVRGADLEGAQVVAERTPLLGAGIRVRPIRPATAEEVEAAMAAPKMIELEPERRARLVAFIEGNDMMPAEAKLRLLSQLEEPQVPADVVARIESRMGS